MTRLAAVVALLLAVGGCAPLYWVRPDTSQAQLEQDLAQCQQQAWREASWRSSFYRPLAPTIIHDVHGRRHLVWPYAPFSDPYGDRFFEETRLAHFCMRAKGYELVPAEAIQPSPDGASSGRP